MKNAEEIDEEIIMRIIGGKYRSRVLAEFAGDDVRPTSDRTKESLFNILALKLYGARVLDLFCGSGALGLESLSRGAKEVVFNDCAKASIGILKKNLTALKILPNGEEAKITNCDYLVCLGQAKGQFDLIFIDPPYAMKAAFDAVTRILEAGLAAPGAIIVAESGEELPSEDLPAGLTLRKAARYSLSHVAIYAFEG